MVDFKDKFTPGSFIQSCEIPQEKQNNRDLTLGKDKIIVHFIHTVVIICISGMREFQISKTLLSVYT